MNKYLLGLLVMFNLTMYIDGGEGGGGDGGDNGGEGGENGNEEKLIAGKFKSHEELEKGYKELETAFSGKDEAHRTELAKYAVPEEYAPGEEWGNDNPEHNRLQALMQEIGKEHGMTQGLYTNLFEGIVEMQDRIRNESLEAAQKSIDNYETRANAIADTISAHLRPDQAHALNSLTTTKESFEAIEILASKIRGNALPNETDPASEISDSELRKQIKALNPADTRERDRLLEILNARGGGEGKLV